MATAPKILILGEAAAIHTRRWVGWFRGRGWKVRWLSFPPIAEGVDAELIPPRHSWRAMGIVLNKNHITRVIDEFRPDVISALFLPDYGWLAALAGGHPLAVSAWGSDVLIAPHKSPIHKWRIRSVLNAADLLFADAELLRSAMLDLGAQAGKIQVFPLGVDPALLEIGRSRQVAATPIRLISTRRLEPVYQIDTFIRAVAECSHDRGFQFATTIVGDGTLRSSLEGLAGQLGVGDRVAFSGAVSDNQMTECLRDADIYVSCSRSDGTSVSLLEAMATGVFPIVTDIPANREWIDNGTNGLLYPVGDSVALSAAILRAAGDQVLRNQGRLCNLDIIAERALWPDNMMTAERHLRKLIGIRE